MTLEIDLQSEKQNVQRILTERGSTIDFNEQQPLNADSPI
jgi:hypothetical protein